MNLQKLLCAKSIAVVGATEKIGFSSDTCRNILTYQKDLSRVYFVNPNRDTVFEQKCYHSLSEIDDTVDLVVLCTPQATIIPLLREASKKGCGGAVIYAAGYSEVGTPEGRAAESELIAVANELGIAIMGPNCVGFINYIDQVFAFACTSQERDRKGSVGFLSQSGQFCLTTLDSPSIKLSYLISVGNSKVVQIEDYIDFLVDDEDTHVIALYLEGVSNPDKFAKCLRKAAEKRKPVVVFKAGRSARGAALTSSHTGALSGSDKVFDAIFNKFGVIRVDDLQDLIGTASLLSTMLVLPKDINVASVCISGGETGICADMTFLNNISTPDLAQTTKDVLKELLPFATPGNPMDTTAPPAYDADLLCNCLLAIDKDPNTDMILLGMTILDQINDSSMEIMYNGIEQAKIQGMQKPMALLSFIETTHNSNLQDRYIKLGIPILAAPKYGLSALRNMMKFIAYKPESRTLTLAIPNCSINSSNKRGLSEQDSKKLLVDHGISIHLGTVVQTVEDAVSAADKMGYPVVMKIESSEIQHKSDVGGVKLNIRDAKQAGDAYNTILSNVAEKSPNSSINGILVQKMLPQGTEFIVGVNNDAQFGPMVLVGMGGVFVEVFKDIAIYPAPLNRFEALEMLSSLKSYKLLCGYRGNQNADIDALANIIEQISQLAAEKKNTLLELDLNPVFVYPVGNGVGIADALAILSDE